MVLALLRMPPMPQICVQCQEPAANPIRSRCRHIYDRTCFDAIRAREDGRCTTCNNRLEEAQILDEETSDCFEWMKRIFTG